MGVPLYFKHLITSNDDIIIKMNEFNYNKKLIYI